MKKSLKRNNKSRKTARIRRRPKRLKRLSRGRGGIVSSKKKTKRKHRRKLKGGMNEGVTRDIHTLDIIAHPLNRQQLKMIEGHGSDKLTFDFTDDTVILYYPRINQDYDYLILDEERRFISKPTIVHKSTVVLDKGYLVDCIYQKYGGGFRNDTVGKKVNFERTHSFTVDNSYIVKPIDDDEPIAIDCGGKKVKQRMRDLFLRFQTMPTSNIREHSANNFKHPLSIRKILLLVQGMGESTSCLQYLSYSEEILRYIYYLTTDAHEARRIRSDLSFIVNTTLRAGEDDADDEDGF